MWQVTDAVRYMHDNLILHRDLKLSNVFLGADMQVKIGDFGLALPLKEENELRYSFLGTPGYMAPEIVQIKNIGSFNVQGYNYSPDIWAIGVFLYNMLCGKMPFDSKETIREEKHKEIYDKTKKGAFSFPEDSLRHK
jgi:serine/threonine protein kinase